MMPRPSLNLLAQNPCLSNPCISICLSESLIYFYQVFPQPLVFQIKQTKSIQSLPVAHNPYSRRHSGQPLLQPFLFHTLPVMGQPRLHTILIHIQLHRDFLTLCSMPRSFAFFITIYLRCHFQGLIDLEPKICLYNT